MAEKAATEAVNETPLGSLVLFGTILAGLLVGWSTSIATGDDTLAIGTAAAGMLLAFLGYSYVTYGR